MSDQALINLAICAVVAVIGWFARQLWDAVQSLKDDMRQIEVDLPTYYVRKEDLESRLDKIDDILNRIFERLESKVDKEWTR